MMASVREGSPDHRGHEPAAMDLPGKLWLARLMHGISPTSVALAYADWAAHLMASPSRQAQLWQSALHKGLQLSQYGTQAGQPLPDKRFPVPHWQLPPFNALATAFLLNQQWWAEAMQGVRGVSAHHEQVAAFTTRQWLDMWSPSNFIATNPQVIRETLATGGANLANGWANFLRDAQAVLGNGRPRGVEQFIPGETVAVTQGEVVFSNHLIELIQYRPTTATVKAEPLLIVPSWIMKYYILDLTPDDSLVKFLVDRGHPVFMVSWNNPGGADRGLGMDDYLEQGVMQALRAVQSVLPRTKIHAVGYCLGGTLLSIAAAALGRSRSSPLRTVSLLAAQTDFHEPGELGLFIDESQIAFLEDLMAERGYLDGRQMAGAFQLINSKDLVWSKLVHEYLMGARTPMTALRAWNADATRLPARMHSEYLRRLYLGNDLAEGRYPVAGQPVRLGDLRVPMFVVATEQDHVSPWRSVYKIHGLARAPVTFALASGGHNAGIVSPPSGPMAHPQARFRLASCPAGKAPDDPAAWLELAKVHQGSWWRAWAEWLAGHSSGGAKPPAMPARHAAGTAKAAPGSYVHHT